MSKEGIDMLLNQLRLCIGLLFSLSIFVGNALSAQLIPFPSKEIIDLPSHGTVTSVEAPNTVDDDVFSLGALSLKEGDLTVKGAVGRWCQNNGWKLIWEPDIDFLIQTEIEYSLDIRNALSTLFDHLAASGPRLHAVMYTQNKVLIIKKLY